MEARRGPIGGNEINAPEMRRRSKEFEANALAFVGGVAEKHDAAFLLFLRKWIGEDQHRVHVAAAGSGTAGRRAR